MRRTITVTVLVASILFAACNGQSNTTASSEQTSTTGLMSLPAGQEDWPSYGRDHDNSRLQASEDTLTVGSVAGMEVRWRIDGLGGVTGTAAIVGGVVFFGDWNGWLWAVDTPYAEMAVVLIVLGAGFGLVIAPIGTAVINAAPEPERGIASGLVIMLRLMGMSVGLAGLTAWGLHRYDVLRTTIALPDLPFTDPVYQRAVMDGLTAVSVHILTETFLLSALVALIALLISWKLRGSGIEA